MILSHPPAIRIALSREPSLPAAFMPAGDGTSATSRIWDDAGFLPPEIYRCIVDLLHYSMTEDDIDEGTVVLLVSWFLDSSGYAGEYIIRDPARLRQIAADYGVSTDRRSDEAVARDVTRAVIGEYGAGA
jgi:hypothetical protein